MLAKLSISAAVFYLAIYALEAPVRYALYLGGKDWAILGRDVLIFGPLALIVAAQALRGQLQPAFPVFAVLLAFHALVLMGTIGSTVGVVYGVKILVNLLLGFLLASLLVSPGRVVLRVFMVLWCLTLVGVLLDKFVLTFPWTGIRTVIGDLNVDVSKDWSIQDSFSRRVAGFTRSSISVAAFLPVLAIVLMCATRNTLVRSGIAVASVVAVFLTTQKGALLAFVPVVLLLLWPGAGRLALLRGGCVAFLLLMVGLPYLTSGLIMPSGGGVFSVSSFAMRIEDVWPDALHWIERRGLWVFGVGLGGISGGQRVYAPDHFNPADNMGLLLYAYFGVFALLYLGFVMALVLRRVTGMDGRVTPALAIVMFQFGYGAVLSIIEDQSASLFLGAAVGVLWLETRRAPSVPGHFIALPPRYRLLTRQPLVQVRA
ncbi:MAG: hypothetical protein H7Z10_01100 [Gemmatimonadaceae bacterium]|nr:hypothetical protein [Acetobacteraceae bacterium]